VIHHFRAVLALVVLCFAADAARAQQGDRDCEDQQNDPCVTGEPGICSAGRLKCTGNGLRCERIQGPVAEDCDNGQDDDCDGTTDGADANCRCPDADADGWAACFSGCALQSGDACGDCDDSRAAVNPNRAEACNGRDDDCDGATDEANPGGGAGCQTGQPGICSAGTLRCTSGTLRCERNLAPRDEDCDNDLDDDCDGMTDSGDASCVADCGSAADVDADRVADCADNCPNVANSRQDDYDGDGLGDACESGVRLCDIDRSGRVDGVDLARLGRLFGRSCGDSGFDRTADLTRDCQIDGDDLATLAAVFGGH
jgi:hypothetical protein